MNSSLKLLISSVTLALMGMSLSACGGAECATNTEEDGGECKVKASACGTGTTLADGVCKINDTGCGDGSRLENGVCVVDSVVCGTDTTFDTALGKCVSSTEPVECGDNTKLEGGECVPDDICVGGTTLNADGKCTIDPASCGTGTQLDPNNGICAVTDAVCGDNTAFDADSDTCVPQDTVCSTGTVFNTDSGLCVPDASVCTVGDVIVDGVCTSPGQVLFDDANTIEGVENDDTNKGGTANAITLAAEGSSVVFKGTIGAAVDLDNDSVVDQDYDRYTFTGTAGTYLNLKLQTLDGASLAYVVTGPNGYTRFAPLALGVDAERGLYLPEDGEYTVTVAPAIVLAPDSDAGPLGGDTWNYVAELSTLPAITATDIDTTAAPITGNFADLSDNLYKITNLTTGGIADITVNSVGANAVGVMSVWTSPTELFGTFDVTAGQTVTTLLPAGDIFVFFDWTSANGPDLAYDVSVGLNPNQQTLGTLVPNTPVSSTPFTFADGDVYYYSVTVPAGNFLEVGQANSDTEGVEYSVTDADGNNVDTDLLFSGSATSPEYRYIYAETETSFLIRIEADDDVTDFVLTTNAITPIDQVLTAGGQTVTTPVSLTKNRAVFYKANIPAGDVLEVYSRNNENEEIRLYVDEALSTGPGDRLYSRSFFDVESDASPETAYVAGGPTGKTVFVRADATEDLTGFELNLNSVTPTDLGSIAVGGTLTLSDMGPVAPSRGVIAKATSTEALTFSGQLTATGSGTPELSIYGGNLAVENRSGMISASLPAGELLFIVKPAGAELDMGYTGTLSASLPPQLAATYASYPYLAIPDSDETAGITDTLNVPDTCTITGTSVETILPHTFRADVLIRLTSPAGTQITITEDLGGSADDFIGTFDTDFPTVDPLSTFDNESATGDWTIYVADDAGGDVGILNAWGLTFTCL